MKLTIKEIKEAQERYVSVGGINDSSLQAIYYSRPVSYYLTWLFARVGLSANNITILALLFDVFGCLSIVAGGSVLGAIGVNIGHLLDYVDGTLAKATETVSKYGAWLDSVCDELVEVMIPLAVGYGARAYGDVFPVLGIVCAILHPLGALAALHTRRIFGLADAPSGFMRIPINIGVNLKAVATILLIPATIITGGLAVFIVGYTLLTVSEFVARLLFGGNNEDRKPL